MRDGDKARPPNASRPAEKTGRGATSRALGRTIGKRIRAKNLGPELAGIAGGSFIKIASDRSRLTPASISRAADRSKRASSARWSVDAKFLRLRHIRQGDIHHFDPSAYLRVAKCLKPKFKQILLAGADRSGSVTICRRDFDRRSCGLPT